VAEEHNVSWIILLRRTKIRLYPAQLGLGVGRKGLTETYVEIDLPQLTNANAGYLSLIFSAEALSDGGTAYEILESCRQYAVGLGERLREKVYEEIIPLLSVAVAKSVKGRKQSFSPEMLTRAYDLTLRIFFRILFQVYAEDRKLLPLGENPSFDKLALKTLARKLAADRDLYKSADSSELWEQLSKVWTAIDEGSTALGIPAYNGGLFSSDEELHPESAAIAELSVSDDIMGPVLRALLLDIGDVGDPVPIDFRSLGVREFGTIYEGLLESSLGVAETDLTLDKDKNWVPAKKKSDEIFAPEGSVYFHNTSGQRKGTGSYFTPSFVVEHLLERSLDPALDAHLAKVAELVAKGDDAAATEKFFDFRVADIAMGSGHFLTAAIDHIEKKMAAFLTSPEHPMPGVLKEILELEAAARAAVGADGPEIDRSSLLRRQIARRCIYGLDLNPIAVELSRVSIWIHTFVRGLPMSSLDHNLVCGNSLTGIGTIDEALDVLAPSRIGKGKNRHMISATEYLISEVLNEAKETLIQASQMLELDKAQSRAAAKAAKKARQQANKAARLFDAAVLRRIGRGALVAAEEFDVDGLIQLAGADAAADALKPLKPAHMPSLFPEVFARDNPGFDVLVGNPPWEKLKVEEHQWWGLRIPGLRGMPMAERKRKLKAFQDQHPELLRDYERDIEVSKQARQVLASGPFPGIGSGDIDLYKAFAWRNWQLVRTSGQFGVVLPRSALNGAGAQEWRKAVLSGGSFTDVVTTINSGYWVFANIDARYATSFVVVSKDPSIKTLRFGGPFFDHNEFSGGRDDLAEVSTTEFLSWSESAAFPSLASKRSVDVFRRLRQSKSFGVTFQSDFRPNRELDAKNDNELFNVNLSAARGTVPVFTGSSFEIWQPDYGDVYAKGNDATIQFILEKTQNSAKQSRSAFYGMDIKGTSDLPLSRPRIAFRDVTNATNSRTMIPCLVPPGVVLVHPAPYLVRRAASEADEAFLLGVMSSMVFDWYCRRIVELHLTFEILDQVPIPQLPNGDGKWARVVEISGSLAAVDGRYSEWAKAVGVKVGSVKTADKKQALLAELDALVAAAYSLSQSDVQHIFDTFHRNGDYRERCAAVLSHLEGMGIS